MGYDKAEEWQALLSKYAMEMAAAMKIPWKDFRWYAAFHDTHHHPHIHMVCYSTDPSKGFLTKQGIAQIKSGLAKEIFRQELTEIYQRQTQRRDTLNEDAHSVMEQLIRQIQDGAASNNRIEQLMEHLAKQLCRTSGKKQYGYLKSPLKAVVDAIVDELAKEPSVAAAYDLWYELREEVLRTYKDDLPERLPLSQQPEFKRIKNIVIEEAVRLGEWQRGFPPDGQQEDIPDSSEPMPERTGTGWNAAHRSSADQENGHAKNSLAHMDDRGGPSPASAVARLFQQMAGIFRKQEQPPPLGSIRVNVDRKLLRKIKAKKIAQGHRADDHEPEIQL